MIITMNDGRKLEGAAAENYVREAVRAATSRPGVATAGQAGGSVSLGEFVPLVEAHGAARTLALQEGATANLKLISPGWGSSGYYSAAVLKKAAGVFKAGTRMFWDHPTPAEAAARPEGSLDRMAAVLKEDARWDENGLNGPGLYAKARIFDKFAKPLKEMAKDIGVSVRAWGKGRDGRAEGRAGRIVESIEGAQSVDFVTTPGRGGEIVQLFEAAARGPVASRDSAGLSEAERSYGDRQRLIQRALRVRQVLAGQEFSNYGYVVDVFDADFIYSQGDRYYRATYTMDDSGRVVIGPAVEVLSQVGYSPAPGAAVAASATLGESGRRRVEAGLRSLGLNERGAQVAAWGTAGHSLAESAGDPKSKMVDGFKRLGMSEAAAKAATYGRRS